MFILLLNKFDNKTKKMKNTIKILLFLFLIFSINAQDKKKEQKLFGLIENNGLYTIVTDSGYVNLTKKEAHTLYWLSLDADTINVPKEFKQNFDFPFFFIITPENLQKVKYNITSILIPININKKDTTSKK